MQLDLDPLYDITLRTFLATLSDLPNSSLPFPMQAELNKIAEVFGDEPNDAINMLFKLSHQDNLKKIYEETSHKLHSELKAQDQERNKLAKPDSTNFNENLSGLIDNTIAKNTSGRFPKPNLDNILEELPLNPVNIFASRNSVEAAKNYVNQIRIETQQEVSSMKIFAFAILICE